MITVFTFHPEHFNNNGDQGNLLVLEVEAEAAGAQLVPTTDPESADFVLFGDASRAAMRHYGEELDSLVPALVARYERGDPTLVVGSCYERFAVDLGIESKSMTRRSEFVSQDGFFGYRNTNLDLPIVTRNGNFVATSLFGPFLAKNPEFLGQLLEDLGA
ncbi:MAG: hypothetical protein VWZ99_04045, partial [Aquiluna sp.]